MAPLLKHRQQFSRRRLAVYVGGLLTVGVVVVVAIFAAGTFTAVEPENGTLSNGATSVPVSGASGGRAVQFGPGGTSSPGAPGVAVASFSPTYWAQWSHGPSTDPSYFPVGVFDNDPYWNDDDVKAASINLYVGLYAFGDQYSHYVNQGLVAHNSYAFAGEGADAAGIVGDATGGPHIWGYQPADEAEMKGYDPADVQGWVNDIKIHDTSRPIFVGYGKGLSIPRPGANIFLNGHEPSEYCAIPDVVAADFYGPQDPYNGPTGQYVYGQTIDLMKAACGPTKPVWHYVEAEKVNAPGDQGGNLPAPTALQIQQNAWLGIIHGANGLIYFCHDFGDQSAGDWDTKCLHDPARTPAITQMNGWLKSYAAVLNSPTRGNAVTVSGNTQKVTTLVKYLNGYAYIFAIADGDAAHPNSGATNATFTVDKLTSATVDVQNESRTLSASGGSFSDSFTPFQWHVYRIAM